MSSIDSKKIQTHFQTLSTVASSLNAASDELTKVVGKLDEALKRLNVGLTSWVTFVDRRVHDPVEYDCDQIGYCKVNGKWGISLRTVWGEINSDSDHNEDGPWLFNDAPREMRLRSVDKISELIESLSKKAAETTKKIQEKTKEVGELADAIEQLASKKVLVSGISQAQLEQIHSAAQRQQKFLGELLMQAGRWELEGSDLRIFFPSEKRPFAEMLEGRDALAKVRNLGEEVLGIPIQVTVHVEAKSGAAPQRAVTSSGKVQK